MTAASSIEVGAPTARKRFRAPPITGRGTVKTFRLRLYEGGITKVFVVAAYSRKQAAALLEVSESYLKQHGNAATADEIERAEIIPGQVWVHEPGSPNFTKWRHQLGTTWA